MSSAARERRLCRLEACGAWFTPKRINQYFCTPEHRLAHHQIEKRAAMELLRRRAEQLVDENPPSPQVAAAVAGLVAHAASVAASSPESGDCRAYTLVQTPLTIDEQAPRREPEAATKAIALGILDRVAGCTCAEMAEQFGVDRQSLSKRLADLVPDHAHQGERRICTVTGRRASTWHAGRAARSSDDELRELVLLKMIDCCDRQIANTTTAAGLREAWKNERARLVTRLCRIPRR